MIVTYDELLQRVWGRRHADDTRTLRTAVKKVRRKPGDEANQPVYVFNAPRIGCHMGMAEYAGPWSAFIGVNAKRVSVRRQPPGSQFAYTNSSKSSFSIGCR